MNNLSIHSEVLPLQKGGMEKVLTMLKGGTNRFEVVLTREFKVLAKLMVGGRGVKGFHPLKGGGGGAGKVLPCLGGGAKSWTHNFPILKPPARN